MKEMTVDGGKKQLMVKTAGFAAREREQRKGLRPISFNPCSAPAPPAQTWGTRPISSGLCYNTDSVVRRPFETLLVACDAVYEEAHKAVGVGGRADTGV
jgi:hypothetical protein